MAHDLDMSNGRANVMVVGEPAWHRLGTVLDDAPTSEAAMRFAGLDWRVEQWPLMAASPDDSCEAQNVEGMKALVRTDTRRVLGVHGESYRPLQNRDAFSFMDSLVEDGQVRYESAGSLKGGRVVWMLARIPTQIRVGSDDVTNPYVLLSNSHDGTQAIRVYPTAVRVVCNNTLTWAHASNRHELGIRIMHVGDIHRKVAEARNALGLVVNHFERYAEQANTLAERELEPHEAFDYLRATFPMPDEPSKRTENSIEQKWDRLNRLYVDHPTNNIPGIARTAWSAFNTVTHYVDHEMRARGEGDRAVENRLRSSWFGQGARIKAAAFDRALELCNN
ncbi:MAG: DUF932 domain-containing protein [Rhodospirillales bacterium]|nr:DUF932 domain-containing protein [Rhodospirillales bacterium]